MVSCFVKKVVAIFLGVVTLSLALGADRARSLEAPRVFRGVLILEGKIVAGDYDTLRNFLATKSTFDKISGGVFLASPGGNLAEAMRIGRLIRALRLSTDAPSGPAHGRKFGESVITPSDLRDPKTNYQCASACFLLFVSGIYRNIYWAGRLGVHRPFQLNSELRKLHGADQTLIDGRIRRAVESYLREMNVRVKYVELMFSVPSSDIRWISQDQLDADLEGFIPELKDVVDAKCAVHSTYFSNMEKTVPVTPDAGKLARCRLQIEAQLRSEQPAEGWRKVFGGGN